MEQAQIIRIMQDAIYTILEVSAPVLLVGLVVGVAVSIFQATTQINEQSMAFVPKIIAILVALVLFGGWMITRLTEFTYRIYGYIDTMVR